MTPQYDTESICVESYVQAFMQKISYYILASYSTWSLPKAKAVIAYKWEARDIPFSHVL